MEVSEDHCMLNSLIYQDVLRSMSPPYVQHISQWKIFLTRLFDLMKVSMVYLLTQKEHLSNMFTLMPCVPRSVFALWKETWYSVTSSECIKSGRVLHVSLPKSKIALIRSGGGGRRKGSSFSGNPAKKLRNLASKVIILRLRHHQDSYVTLNQQSNQSKNAYFERRWDNQLYFKRMYLRSILLLL